MAASEGPRSVAVAVESQQAVASPSAAMITAVSAPSVPPAWGFHFDTSSFVIA
jgi:hypothetical protein